MRGLSSAAVFLAACLFASIGWAQPADNPSVDPTAQGSVAARLSSLVPDELASYFNTVLYSSKAREGTWAQRMYVFERQEDGSFAEVDSFPISTGRERRERYFTTTPSGIYKIDRGRIHRMVRSSAWDGAPMPFAMFFDYSYRTRMTGMALHAASGGRAIADLGTRASGGCIRMPPEKAEALFEAVIAGEHDAMVPEFAFDQLAGTTNREGEMLRDHDGAPVLAPGLDILLVVDDFPGPPSEPEYPADGILSL
jgi:hypothetical protein